MSREEVKAKAKETVRSARELMDAVKKAINAQLSTSAPKVANALDGSFDRAARTLTDALGTIDQKTAREQVELLKAYRSFLEKQGEIVDRRMASVRRKGTKGD